MLALLWFLLVVAGALVLAYQRVSLRTATIAAGAALAAYSVLGDGPLGWMLLLWLGFAGLVALNVDPLRKRWITRPFLLTYRRLLPSMSDTEREALEAGTVWWDGELFTGEPDWSKLAGAQPPRLSPEEQAFLDGPCEELCRMLDDWDITHRPRRPAAAGLGVPEEEGLLRDDHPEEVRRSRVLRVRAFVRAGEDREPQRRRAPRPSPCRTRSDPAELLLHYGTEEQKNHYLPRLARGEDIPCFALTGAARRLGRRIHPRHRRRLPRQLRGPRGHRDQAQFLEALHHARAGRDRDRPRVPAARSRQAAGRRADGLRDHLRADPARHARCHGRAASFPAQRAVPERPGVGQGRVRAARLHHRRPEDGRPGLAHAGRAALGRPLHLAAVELDRRLEGRRLCLDRVRPDPPPVQPAGRAVRGRRSCARAHGRLDLHHGRRALGHDRGDRRRRAAGGAGGDSQVPLHRARPPGRKRRDGRARRQGHHARAEELPRPRLPDRARRDHGRGRQHPDAQPDHLRPGRDPLSSVRAARDERREAQGQGEEPATSSTTRSSATSATRCRTRRAPS